MSNIPGVIFDMDGVIVHSNPVHKESLIKFCEKYGHDLSQSFIENRLYGRTNKEWIPEVFGDVDPDRLEELGAEKEQMFRDIFVPEDYIVEGIHGFLETLRSKDVPMAVATSAPGENADYILSRLEIEDYFETVLDSSHVTTGKPDPEVYLKASAALNRNPTNCIVFEDSVSGVEAGRQEGASVVGITTTHSEEELAPCSLTISNFVNFDVNSLLDLPATTAK